MQLISSIGPYAIDSGIEGLDGLSEFSDVEYLTLPKCFADEQIYKAPRIDFLGLEWTLLIAVLEGRIYKISPQIITADSDHALRAFSATYQHFVERMGEPSESRRLNFFVWRAPEGNLMLEREFHINIHRVTFFLTGGKNLTRKVLYDMLKPSSRKLTWWSRLNRLSRSSSRFIRYSYMISLLIFLPYYNWQYARENTFRDWLIWGEIVPTAKALAWPYFVMQNVESREVERHPWATSQKQIADVNILTAIRAVNRAIGADVQGTHLMNGTSELSTSERSQRVVAYAQQSLQVADGADEETLNKLYPEFGTRLKRDFAEAQRLRILGLTNETDSDLARSQELSAIWRNWYDTNQKQIEEAFNAALQ